MTLSQNDGQLFYKLWLPLLDFVNSKFKVNKVKKMATATSLDLKKVIEVANVLWNNVSIIDDYIKSNKGKPLDEREKSILSNWKKCVPGRYMIERHLKKGTIFISMENEQVYLVSGIISGIDEMFFGAPLPLMIEATLIPFENVIITDGLIMPYNVFMGPGIKRSFKEKYLEAKNSGEIITTL